MKFSSFTSALFAATAFSRLASCDSDREFHLQVYELETFKNYPLHIQIPYNWDEYLPLAYQSNYPWSTFITEDGKTKLIKDQIYNYQGKFLTGDKTEGNDTGVKVPGVVDINSSVALDVEELVQKDSTYLSGTTLVSCKDFDTYNKKINYIRIFQGDPKVMADRMRDEACQVVAIRKVYHNADSILEESRVFKPDAHYREFHYKFEDIRNQNNGELDPFYDLPIKSIFSIEHEGQTVFVVGEDEDRESEIIYWEEGYAFTEGLKGRKTYVNRTPHPTKANHFLLTKSELFPDYWAHPYPSVSMLGETFLATETLPDPNNPGKSVTMLEFVQPGKYSSFEQEKLKDEQYQKGSVNIDVDIDRSKGIDKPERGEEVEECEVSEEEEECEEGEEEEECEESEEEEECDESEEEEECDESEEEEEK